jgi:hypothetical protein
MGLFGLHILVKVGGNKTDADVADALAEFLAWHAIWFFTLPTLYAIGATFFPTLWPPAPFKSLV